MKVVELIQKLILMPQQAEVTVYESDPDDFLPIGKVEYHEETDNNQVRLHSQYAVDEDYA